MADDWCPENDGAYRAEMAALHRDNVDQQLIRARAEIERLREALTDIAEGIPTPDRAEAHRTDGKPSKLDKCHHGLAMYEDCGECVSDFARAALAQKMGG